MENFTLINKTQNSLYNEADNQVLLTFDKNMVIHALNTMYSVAHFNTNISFICMCDDSLKNEQIQEILSSNFGVIIYEYQCQKEIDTKQWTIVSTYRLFSPWLLPNTIKKILYLDSDILCKGDLQTLFSLSLNSPIAMCEDLCSDMLCRNTTTNTIYYNSGVLLYDLVYMREHFDSTDFFNEFTNNASKYSFPDQDFINDFFNKNGQHIFPLNPFVYNFVLHSALGTDLYNNALSNSKLLHFTYYKPWTCWRMKPKINTVYLLYSFYEPMIQIVKDAIKIRPKYLFKQKIKKLLGIKE